ncbi:MAG: hypothetical protein ACK5RG_15510 [Cyclobacteriaceae bacterium]|jgi:hypothetical protein
MNYSLSNRILEFSRVNRLAVSFQNANANNKKMAAIDFRDPEIFTFFQNLEDHEVKYILVGGFAVAFHGYVRATSDLDLWLKSDDDNIERFKKVLIKSGVKGIDQLRSFEMIHGFTQFQIGDSGFVVEPMKSLKTLSEFDFDQAYLRAKTGNFEGLTFKVIHAHDLLREKEATNRPKDQGDIEHLRKLQD